MGRYNVKIFLHNLKKMFIAEPAQVNPPYLITDELNIKAGKESYHNGNFTVKGFGILNIGNYCAIGTDVKIILSNHNINYLSMQYTFYAKNFGKLPYEKVSSVTSIGHDVWIGDNVLILPNITIGNGAVIGGGSIVTKSVEPYSIVAGNPAKFIKKRFSEEKIQEFQKLKWWDWDSQKIRENEKLFLQNVNK